MQCSAVGSAENASRDAFTVQRWTWTTTTPDVSESVAKWREVAWVGDDRARDQTEGDDDSIDVGALRKIVFFFSRALFGVGVKRRRRMQLQLPARSRLGDERNSCQNVGESVLFRWVFVHSGNSQKGKVVCESANL